MERVLNNADGDRGIDDLLDSADLERLDRLEPLLFAAVRSLSELASEPLPPPLRHDVAPMTMGLRDFQHRVQRRIYDLVDRLSVDAALAREAALHQNAHSLMGAFADAAAAWRNSLALLLLPPMAPSDKREVCRWRVCGHESAHSVCCAITLGARCLATVIPDGRGWTWPQGVAAKADDLPQGMLGAVGDIGARLLGTESAPTAPAWHPEPKERKPAGADSEEGESETAAAERILRRKGILLEDCDDDRVLIDRYVVSGRGRGLVAMAVRLQQIELEATQFVLDHAAQIRAAARLLWQNDVVGFRPDGHGGVEAAPVGEDEAVWVSLV